MRFTEYLRDLRDLISATFLNIGSQHRSGVGIVLFLFAASLAVSGDTTFTTGAEPSAITVAQSPADIAGDSGSNPPPGSAEKPVSQNPVQTTTYTVKAGDTLWDIAISCKTTVEQIMALNNLSGEKLSIGQQLVIAGAVPPAQTRQVLQVASRSGASTGASSANSSSVVKKAAQYLNTPYVWGGSRPGGFDCSGFVQYVFAQCGYKLPRTAAEQAASGTKISRKNLAPGDLVYFSYGGGSIDHIGIYVGNNTFIHSSSPRSGGVIYTSLSDSFYANSYAGATRISR